MSMVLEMPLIAAMAAIKPEREILLQERLNAVYDRMFVGLKEQYRILDEKQVFAFLRQHSQLIPLLREGREAVSLFFGEETPVLLKLRRDPEAGLEHLMAWIQTSLPTNEAVDRLFELSDAWFIHRLDTVGDLRNFNLGGKP